jgi:hypothetical protein
MKNILKNNRYHIIKHSQCLIIFLRLERLYNFFKIHKFIQKTI